MESHRDVMHRQLDAEWLKSLESKANEIKAAKGSTITAGDDGEVPLMEYQAKNDVHVRRLPEDKATASSGSVLAVARTCRSSATIWCSEGTQSKHSTLRKALAALEEGF